MTVLRETRHSSVDLVEVAKYLQVDSLRDESWDSFVEEVSTVSTSTPTSTPEYPSESRWTDPSESPGSTRDPLLHSLVVVPYPRLSRYEGLEKGLGHKELTGEPRLQRVPNFVWSSPRSLRKDTGDGGTRTLYSLTLPLPLVSGALFTPCRMTTPVRFGSLWGPVRLGLRVDDLSLIFSRVQE